MLERITPWALAATAAALTIGCQFEYSVLPGSAVWGPEGTRSVDEAELRAEDLSLYEVQVRSANACHPELGSERQRATCATKIAPSRRPTGARQWKDGIRLGTLDDLLEPSTDFRQGLTLAYVAEEVGASGLWLMPVFPHAGPQPWGDPDDDLGAPDAVQDYLHARADLARSCIHAGRDERSSQPCWGNDALQHVVSEAHRRGLRLLLDLTPGHLGRGYRLYDSAGFVPLRARPERLADPDQLWDFEATYDPSLLRAAPLDTPALLEAAATRDWALADDLALVRARCPKLEGDRLVRTFASWRIAFDEERENFSCAATALEDELPGLFLSATGHDPASSSSALYRGARPGLMPLYLRTDRPEHAGAAARARELVFRVLNFWVARGVDGFRLGQAVDPVSGLGPQVWSYIAAKLAYYARRRGQAPPLLVADGLDGANVMGGVADVLVQGYVQDMNGRWGRPSTASWVEQVVERTRKLDEPSVVLTALETHEERRLVDGTGFTAWTGAGVWGIGAAQRSTPLLLMGQELGERHQLRAGRSQLLRSRFEPRADVDALRGYYRRMLRQRAEADNAALRRSGAAFLRTLADGRPDERVFAQVRWSEDGSVVFVLHNLWEQHVRQTYYLPPWLRAELGLGQHESYRLVDLLTDETRRECHEGVELGEGFEVSLEPFTRAQWLRLEPCERHDRGAGGADDMRVR